jgi:hypothetical protein
VTNSRQPFVRDNIPGTLEGPDPNSTDHITVLGLGEYNDLKMCLEQALECLARGEHDSGWVVFETFKLEELYELAQAVVLGCEERLPRASA